MTTPEPILTQSEQSLLDYLQANQAKPTFAVARCQQWHKLLPMLQKAFDAVQRTTVAMVRHQYHASALWLAGSGMLSEANIEGAPMLNPEQKQQCRALRASYHAGRWIPVGEGLPAPMPREYSGAESDDQDETEDYEVWVDGGLLLARLCGADASRVWWVKGENRTVNPTHYRPIIGPPS